MTVFSCDFLRYYTNPGTNSTSLPEPFLGVETAQVGRFRWEDRTEDNAGESYGDCEPYDEDVSTLGCSLEKYQLLYCINKHSFTNPQCPF